MNLDLATDFLSVDADEAFTGWWKSFLRGEQPWDDPSAAPMNVVDLFCGSGGFGMSACLAAQAFGKRAVFRAIADADAPAMDAYARTMPVRRKIAESLATIIDYSVDRDDGVASFDYPPEILNDVLEAEVDNVDLLIAGPPCQGHSNLNNHTRRNDPRNDLFVATAAIGVALKARIVVIENVPSVVRSHGEVVQLARQLLEANGYSVDEGVLKMDALGGWQTRSRYFMVAASRSDVGSMDGAIERWLIKHSPDGTGKRSPQSALWAIEDLQDFEGETVFDTSPVQGPDNARRIKYLFEHNLDNLPNSERPDCHKDGTTYTSVYGRMYKNGPAPTITTGIGTPGQGRFIHPTRPRLITPHEAARIQCFPDGYGFMDFQGGTSRKSLAKWIGDAVPPLLGMTAICSALSAVEGREADLPW